MLTARSRCHSTLPVESLTAIRTTLFAMAFVSIGLETSLRTLVTTDEGRPAIAFLGGQAFNIVVTFVAAYVFFGGFPFAP